MEFFADSSLASDHPTLDPEARAEPPQIVLVFLFPIRFIIVEIDVWRHKSFDDRCDELCQLFINKDSAIDA